MQNLRLRTRCSIARRRNTHSLAACSRSAYGGEVAIHAFGKQTYDADGVAVTADTIFDAASLTKPVVTGSLIAMLSETGQIDLDAPVARYLPEWSAGPNPEWRAKVTVRHLLTHTSGLPAHRDYYKTLKTRREIVAHALAEPLAAEPRSSAVAGASLQRPGGSASEYSDIGFILLGEIIERVTGRPLDELAAERIFGPLGMHDSMFRPRASLKTRIAPTERDADFRKRLMQGEVHDENAWAMGGVAGHAGMFTTAADLAAFCQMMLNGGIYGHQRLLRRSTVEQLTTAEAVSGNTRTLGWMMRTAESSSGRYFSSRSFGHTGFTGTSIWIDPEKHLFVVLLTNRVYPTRDNNQMQQVRPAVHDAIVTGLGIAAGADTLRKGAK